MTTEDILYSAASSLLTEIEEQYETKREEYTELNAYQEYFDTIKNNLQSVQEISQEISSEDEPVMDNVTKLMKEIQCADSTAKLLQSVVTANANKRNQASQVLKNMTSWITTHLIPWIQNLWSSVWTLIQQRVKLKEWKVKGGIGSVLGLANVELEITFV